MFSIRRNVFETNSSSTHSLAIPIENVQYPKIIYFDIGEYGWETEEVDPADYFYTALAYTAKDKDDFIKKRNILENICALHGIQIVCGDAIFSKYNDHLDNGYIDHGSELCDFVNELLEDENRLLKFICGGKVFTGNDNDEESSLYVVNKEIEFINYEWYYKGN